MGNQFEELLSKLNVTEEEVVEASGGRDYTQGHQRIKATLKRHSVAMAKRDEPKKKLPPHLQAVADKAKKDGVTITDVTPEGYGPATKEEE